MSTSTSPGGILRGLRVVEGSAFVACPLAGMTLAQMGAEVIRFDPLPGGLDARRWPVTSEGRSLYWAGLNKGKRSLAVDTSRPEGRELVTRLITAPGPGNGLFLTNLPARGWMAHEALKARRPDLITVTLLGNRDGSSAVDYTVNCAVGFPFVTGPERPLGSGPVNHVLPAWDAMAGYQLALALLAAERHRRLTGEGQLVTLALADVAFALVGHLGYINEVEINKEERQPAGNHLFGAYGGDFESRDGRRLYLAAVTDRMWSELLRVTGLGGTVAALGARLGLDFAREGDRFRASAEISALVRPWCATRTLEELRAAFEGSGVCWGPYQTFGQMVAEDPRCSTANPLFSHVEQPGIGRCLTPGATPEFGAIPRRPPVPAPVLGEHTDEILSLELGMSAGEIGALRDAGVVAGPVALM